MKFIRLATAILDSPSIMKLPASTFRFWTSCLLLARTNDRGEGVLPPEEDVAFMLRMSVDEARMHFDYLAAAGLVYGVLDGKLAMSDWGDFTGPLDPTAADRQRRFRDRKKNAESSSSSNNL